MRLVLYPLLAGLILQAATITSTTCIGPTGSNPHVLSVTGGESAVCPADYVGSPAYAWTEEHPGSATSKVFISNGPTFASAEAISSFEESGVADADGALALVFDTDWNAVQDSARAGFVVTYYFNRQPIGSFDWQILVHVANFQSFSRTFYEPVHAGDAYSFGAQVDAVATGQHLGAVNVTISDAPPVILESPEPTTALTMAMGLMILVTVFTGRKRDLSS